MKNFRLPHLGSRNIKTALSVLVCLIFLPDSIFAPIAAVICVQDTVENSVTAGLNRLIGTFLGGLLGVMLLLTMNTLNLSSFSSIVSALGVCLIIYICNLVKKPAACAIASIVLIGIVVSKNTDGALMYSINKTFETAVGILIAVFINKYIHPPKIEH